MSALMQALTAFQRELAGETRGYAWLITKDHSPVCDGHVPADLSTGARYCDGRCTEGEKGTSGPSDAPADLLALLKQGEGTVFKMYDDDGELYYTGRLVTTEDAAGTEEASYGPLGDFGMPNAGATEIRYPSKPEWNIG